MYKWKKIWVTNFEQKIARKECCHFNKIGRKINFNFFSSGCATQNKAPDMIK